MGARPILALFGVLLACVAAEDAPKKACSSSLKGDYQFEACGAFCKDAKKANHCKFCKCKACTFCAAGASSTSAPPALSPRRRPPPPPRWPKKGKKAKKKGVDEAAVGGPSPSVMGEKPKKQKCESSLKGDLPFMTCATFCKSTKATNHCKFCKCRTCPYCAADGKPSAAAASLATAATTASKAAPGAAGGASVAGAASDAGTAGGVPQRGVPVDTAARTGFSHMRVLQGVGVAVLLVLAALGLIAFTSQGDATVGSWQHTLQTHLSKMGLSNHGREGVRLNPEASSSNDLDAAFKAVDKLEADMSAKR